MTTTTFKTSRIRIVHERTRRRFRGRYKGHEIDVAWLRDGRYYIQVTTPSGQLSYDGWWAVNATMDEAIEQALRGSLLYP